MSDEAPAIALAARRERDSGLGAGAGDRPRRAAAVAVPSAVRVPEARRVGSMGGMRFFWGEMAGVAIVSMKRFFFVDLGEPREVSCWSGE